MPRQISSGLNHVMLDATERRPAWSIQIYDVRSTTDTIGDIVRFNVTGAGSLQLLTGPLDFTEFTTTIAMSEQRSDYVAGSVTASVATITIVDPNGIMDPLLIVGVDPDDAEYATLLGRFLRRRNVVVIRYGDSRVDSAEWPIVFTGEISGQVGRSRSRSDGPSSFMTFKALSREASFSKYPRTSSSFNTANTFLFMAQTIAEEEMGLDVDETDLGGWGAALVPHNSVQLVEETPMAMLAKIMFPDGFMPKFRGDGVLTQTSSTITGLPQRVYEDLKLFRSIDRPATDVEQANCVKVIGLGATMVKISQPFQTLATADITTGFFADGEDFNVWFSDDRTIVAEECQAKILRGINDGFGELGGEENFTFIAAPGPGGGFIGCQITMDTGYAPWIVVFLLVTYVVLAAVPDEVLTVGFGVGGGITINLGGIAQAAALAAALYAMTKIGRGQYELQGIPIEWIFPEIRGEACVEGVGEFEENTLEVENHLIATQTKANSAARNILLLLQAQENERSVEMLHDLLLEPDDIFELPTGQRFLIDTISYTLVRDPSAAIKASMKCFEVTPGVLA